MNDLGRVGIWQGVLDGHPAGLVCDTVAELDEAGWPTIWIPETVSRDPFVFLAIEPGTTENLQVATGIASNAARRSGYRHRAAARSRRAKRGEKTGLSSRRRNVGTGGHPP